MLFFFESSDFSLPEVAQDPYKIARKAWEREVDREIADRYFRREMVMKRIQMKPSTIEAPYPVQEKIIPKNRLELSELTNWLDPMGWTQFLLGRPIWYLADLTTGYGTSWLRVLGSWFVIIFGFWGWFVSGNSLVVMNFDRPARLFEKLYFSIITFTTLGYGEIAPRNLYWQMISGVESILGGILMAAFVLVFARKL